MSVVGVESQKAGSLYWYDTTNRTTPDCNFRSDRFHGDLIIEGCGIEDNIQEKEERLRRSSTLSLASRAESGLDYLKPDFVSCVKASLRQDKQEEGEQAKG